MTYTVMSPQPSGLQPNEVAVTLTDISQNVAVTLTSTPVANNAGIDFFAQVRAINADGSTVMHGTVSMITGGHHLSSHDEVAAMGNNALAKAMIDCVLGEPIATTTVNSGGTSVTVPVIQFGSDQLTSWNIRNMLAASTASGTLSASSVLG